MLRIKTKYQPEALVPLEAIVGATGEKECITKDGVKVKLSFYCGCDNAKGDYDEYLDDYCQMNYNMAFNRFRNNWCFVLNGDIRDFWYIVRMEKI